MACIFAKTSFQPWSWELYWIYPESEISKVLIQIKHAMASVSIIIIIITVVVNIITHIQLIKPFKN